MSLFIFLSLRRFLRHLATAAGLRPRWLPRLSRAALRVAAHLAECRGWLFGKEPYPSLQHSRVNDYYWYVSAERATRELGFQARPLETSLADTSRWFQSQNPRAMHGLSRWWLRPEQVAG